jgi:hypothetical protein
MSNRILPISIEVILKESASDSNAVLLTLTVGGLDNVTLTEFPLERAGHVDTESVAGELLKPRSFERSGDFLGYQRLVLGHLVAGCSVATISVTVGLVSGVLSGDPHLLWWLLTANRRHFCRVD